MDIIRARRERRLNMIGKMSETINRCFDKGGGANFKELIKLSCLEWGISDRTAKEYLEIAILKSGAKLDGDMIVPILDIKPKVKPEITPEIKEELDREFGTTEKTK